MKKLNSILNISVFILFVILMASCLKNEDPNASYTPEREAGLIKEWMTNVKIKKLHLDSTSTGIYYITDTTKIGTGPTIKTGDAVTVKYTGAFLDGGIFDQQTSYTFIHKDTDPEKRMVQGWEEGIEVLNKGASAVFLIPSAKGYGSKGSQRGIIPPNSPLLFIIEVVTIK